MVIGTEHVNRSIDESFRQLVRDWRDMGWGRMMQIIAEEWAQVDPIGAHTTGPARAIVLKSMERCRTEGHDWSHGGDHDYCDRTGCHAHQPCACKKTEGEPSRG